MRFTHISCSNHHAQNSGFLPILITKAPLSPPRLYRCRSVGEEFGRAFFCLLSRSRFVTEVHRLHGPTAGEEPGQRVLHAGGQRTALINGSDSPPGLPNAPTPAPGAPSRTPRSPSPLTPLTALQYGGTLRTKRVRCGGCVSPGPSRTRCSFTKRQCGERCRAPNFTASAAGDKRVKHPTPPPPPPRLSSPPPRRSSPVYPGGAVTATRGSAAAILARGEAAAAGATGSCSLRRC